MANEAYELFGLGSNFASFSVYVLGRVCQEFLFVDAHNSRGSIFQTILRIFGPKNTQVNTYSTGTSNKKLFLHILSTSHSFRLIQKLLIFHCCPPVY